MIDLGQPIESRRFRGPADYRGWALVIDTDLGPGMVKRWTMGHDWLVCVALWVVYRLGLRRTWRGERVLRCEVAFLDWSRR
jgi:hypothetical protein